MRSEIRNPKYDIIRVMLVEDNPGDARLIREMLQETGATRFELAHVERLDEALKRLGEEAFDAMILDLNLPNSQGLDTFVSVYAQVPEVAIVVLTGLADEVVGVEAVKRGAQDYLVKGQVDGNLLVRTLRYAIERKRAEEELRKHRDHLEELVQERTAELVRANEQLKREITERKRAEEALRESEERFRILSEAAFEAIAVHEGGVLLRANDQFFEMFGYEADELFGKQVIPLIVAPQSIEFLRQQISSGSTAPYEAMGLRKDGTQFPMEIRAKLMEYQGRMVRVTAIRDITERKRAEEALRGSEARYRELADSIADVFFAMDKHLRYTYWNRASEELTGIAAKDAIGKSLYDLFPDTPDTREAERAYLNVLRTQQSRSFVSKYRLGGEDFFFEISVYPSREGITVFTKDITERKRAEEALRDSRHMLQTVLDSIPSAVFWKDRDSIYLGGNRTWLEAVGLKSSEEVVGKSDYDLPWEKEQADSFREYDRRVMESGIPEYDIIESYLRADGTHAWAKTNKVPLRDTEGNVIGILGTYEDITERKRSEEELRKYREHLEEMVAERTAQLEAANEDLEAFAYSVSHDLRAPLRAISGFAQIIASRHRASLSEEGQHYFDNVIEASGHMGQLIDDLLRYARLGRTAVRRQPVPLGDLLSQVADSLADRVTETDARLSLPPDLPIVRGDPTLLSQILTNLLDNALIYHRPGVPPRVMVGCQAEANHVIISVADNGIGIPSEFHQKIFNIFQRLYSQDEYPGTGIGLAIVKKAAALLGGRVWVESVVGEGSTFFVQLPVITDH